MVEAHETFRGLVGVVTPAPVCLLHGTWEKTHGNGNPEVINCHYKGAFEGDAPLVGLAMLCEPGCIRWVKSSPTLPPRAEFELSLLGWTSSRRSALVRVELPGASISAGAEGIDEPPDLCVVHEGNTMTGVPHVVFRLPALTCAVVLLRRSDVKSGRNYVWRLRQEFAAQLSPTLARCMTHGRTGKLTVEPCRSAP
jgi:hypothetical protein